MSTTTELHAPAAPASAAEATRVAGDVTEAAGPLIVAGDLTVEGAICAGARVRAAGRLVVSGGDVEAALVLCGDAVLVPRGAIRGGRVAAVCGITCRAAGDPAGTVTELALGPDAHALDAVERRLNEIQAALQKADDFSARLQPLMGQKGLTAAQKERISEMLYNAAEARKRATTAVRACAAQLDALEAAERERPAECVVHDTLHAGVTVSFPEASAEVTAAIPGPVRLSTVREGRLVSIVAALADGEVRVLDAATQVNRLTALRARLARMEEGL